MNTISHLTLVEVVAWQLRVKRLKLGESRVIIYKLDMLGLFCEQKYKADLFYFNNKFLIDVSKFIFYTYYSGKFLLRNS